MNYKKILSAALVSASLAACVKPDPIHILNQGNFTDTNGPLKSATSLKLGMSIGTATYANSNYSQTVNAEANAVTFENEMKYGSVVKNDGTLDFTAADALYSAASGAGLDVFGHNLYWHSQQNAAYLTSIAGSNVSGKTPNVLSNGSFETWPTASSAPTGLNYLNGPTYFSQGSGSANVEDGTYSLVVAPYSAASLGSSWHVQAGTTFTAIAGHTYSVSFYAKSSAAGGAVQYEWQDSGNGGAHYGSTTLTTSWTKYAESYSGFQLTAVNTSITLTFDLAYNTSTVYLDNVVVTDLTAAAAAASPAGIAALAHRMDSVLGLWIVGTDAAPGIVTHFKEKVKAWDAANEVLAESGALRIGSNESAATQAASGYFSWNDFLGKNGVLSAFNYAHQADPDALLFINDFNLESNTVKLDSLVSFVNWLKAQGAPINGIGTQMHINNNTSYGGIDAAFQALASTGLLVRISELDVRVNPNNNANINLTSNPLVYDYQAAMYQYVVSSYLKNVPASQQYGITIWGVDDADSWITKSSIDAPLLFDKDFKKKPAYSGVLQALKGK